MAVLLAGETDFSRNNLGNSCSDDGRMQEMQGTEAE